MPFPTPRHFLTRAALAFTLFLGACTISGPPPENYSETTLLDAGQKQALEQRVSAFERDLNSGDIAALPTYMPPKVLAAQAKRAGMTPQAMQAALVEMLNGTTRNMKIRGTFHLPQALVGTTDDGQPYAVIPATAHGLFAGQRVTTHSFTLALQDDGKWYLAAVNDQRSLDAIQMAYPELRDVISLETR